MTKCWRVLLSIVLALFGNSVAFSEEEAKKPTLVAKESEEIRAEFKIAGTDCPVCLNRIKNKIDSLKGVKKSSIWLWRPYYGMVVYDSSVTTWKAIENAVQDEHVEFSDLPQQTVTRQSGKKLSDEIKKTEK